MTTLFERDHGDDYLRIAEDADGRLHIATYSRILAPITWDRDVDLAAIRRRLESKGVPADLIDRCASQG